MLLFCCHEMTLSETSSCDLAADQSRNRLSSFFSSLRRASTSSSTRDPSRRVSTASLSSLISVWGSPTSLLTSGPSGKKHKGLAGMIRASKRFTAQSSVICQNGDVIIVKGGKIVSIRREEQGRGGVVEPGTLLQPRALPYRDDVGSEEKEAAWSTHSSNLTLGCSNQLINSYTPAAAVTKWGSLSSDVSDDVFHSSSSSDTLHCDGLLMGSLMDMIGETQRLLSSVETTEADHFRTSSSYTDLSLPRFQRSVMRTTTTDTEDMADVDCLLENHAQPKDVGVIISLDEDNSILNVMPLTPLTRDRITRSALDLTKDSRLRLTAFKGAQTSAGVQGCHAGLPSIEHLDLPLGLKRSSSDFDVRPSFGSQRLEFTRVGM